MGIRANLIALPDNELGKYKDYLMGELPSDFDFNDNLYDNYPNIWLDKMWDVLNYILTNPNYNYVNSEMLTGVILGHNNFFEVEDFDFLPKIIDKESIKNFSNALIQLDFLEIVNRVNLQELNFMELYPFFDEWDKIIYDIKERLIFLLNKLNDFYQLASQLNYVVISSLS